MALKDLSAYLAPDLELVLRGKTYTVAPPTKEVGLQLAAINAAGVAAYANLHDRCPTCGRDGGVELPDDTRAVLDAIKESELGVLSLGADVHAEMIADKVPGPDVDKAALYALYYWTLGEATADAIFAAEAEALAGGDASGEASVPGSGSSTSTPGPRTASGNRTQRRASSRATGQHRKR